MFSVVGVLLGLAVGSGVLLVVSGRRKASLADAVMPLVRGEFALRPTAAADRNSRSLITALRGRLIAVLDALFGAVNARSRIAAAGLDWTVERFRIEQLRWAIEGMAVAVSLGLVRLLVGRGLPVAIWMLMTMLGAAAGAALAEQRLAYRALARQRRIALEAPTVAEMLAFTVAAGLAPQAALARVASRSGGELGWELRRCVDAVAAGEPFADALRAVGERVGVASVARLVDTVIIAMERGSPLAEVLRAQAMDSRAAGHRELMESVGRREVFALIPVVFMILPVVVVIAVFPGFYGLTINVP